MITERHEELAALHALGLLEGAERTAFEAEVARDSELAGLLDGLRETGSLLAFAAPGHEPPPDLRRRVLAAAGDPEPVPVFPWSRWLPLAAAAGFAFAALWFALANRTLREENAALRSQRELAEVAYQSARLELKERSLVAEQMVNDLGRRLRNQEDLSRLKITALASLAGNTKEAQAIAVWDPGQQNGLLTVDKLPAIADDQDYQIWVVDPAYKNPVNGGVFHSSADGHVAVGFKPDQPVKQVAAFAISLERKGGVPKAEGPIVLLGK